MGLDIVARRLFSASLSMQVDNTRLREALKLCIRELKPHGNSQAVNQANAVLLDLAKRDLEEDRANREFIQTIIDRKQP